MDTFIIGILAITFFVLLISQGIPLSVSFSVVGFLGISLFRGFPAGLNALGSVTYEWASSQMFLPVPLFIFMGYLIFVSGIAQDLYSAAYKWFAKLPGGIAIATTAACTIFAACCGAVPAAAATMSAIAYPEMNKLNYDKQLSTGCIAAGATISILIPPSIPFILYGMLAEVSVASLFIAGIIPGVILAILFMILIYVMCKRNPKLGPPGSSSSWRERLFSLKNTWSILILFVLIIGGLYIGIFTPSEAGAIGAFGAFVITLAMRRLTFSKIISAAKETALLTSSVTFLVIGAMIFNLFLGVTSATTLFANWITSIPTSPYIILGSIIILYIILGMFIDIMAIILLTVPTLAPIMSGLGFDLTWFGVITVLLAMIGFLSPPVGMCSYIVQGVTKVPLEDVFKGAIPFMIVMLILILLLIIFPSIVLFLPSAMNQ